MIMGTIFELQRWLYTGALEALNALHTAGGAGLPALIGAAFGFGMLQCAAARPWQIRAGVLLRR